MSCGHLENAVSSKWRHRVEQLSEWDWFGYLDKYTMLFPTPSFPPWLSPHQFPESSLVWVDSMAICGFQAKEPGHWFWDHPGVKCCGTQMHVKLKNLTEAVPRYSALRREASSFVSVSCLLRASPGLPPFAHGKADFLPLGVAMWICLRARLFLL